MNTSKLDAELLLALDTNANERVRSLDLSVGYEQENNTWELIIKYSGNLDNLVNDLSVIVTPLLSEFAIIHIAEEDIGRLSEYSQIEYIEKPKTLAFAAMEGISASCVNPVRLEPRYEVDSDTIEFDRSANIEVIKKYKELLDIGVITQEEFDIKKKELL